MLCYYRFFSTCPVSEMQQIFTQQQIKKTKVLQQELLLKLFESVIPTGD
jgi:hypothetical protein